MYISNKPIPQIKNQINLNKQGTNVDHLKKNYLSYINGPILFTAPHSKRLNRGGKQYNQKLRIHQREVYASYLATYLAKQTKLSKKQLNSFCVWGKSSQIDQKDLDPNYLIKSNIQKSPFHQILHKWVDHHITISNGKQNMKPLLHVDIHGKMDRQHNCQIEVGTRCMQVHWQQNPLIETLQKYFHGQFGKIFDGLQFGKFQCKFNCDCYLHGYWGGNLYTMNQQAIIMGIPSFQLQIPRKVRQKLFKDQILRKKFANGILQIYNKIICPWWVKNQSYSKLKINKQLGLKAQKTIKSQQQVDQVINQIQAMDKKAQLLLNVKFI